MKIIHLGSILLAWQFTLSNARGDADFAQEKVDNILLGLKAFANIASKQPQDPDFRRFQQKLEQIIVGVSDISNQPGMDSSQRVDQALKGIEEIKDDSYFRNHLPKNHQQDFIEAFDEIKSLQSSDSKSGKFESARSLPEAQAAPSEREKIKLALGSLKLLKMNYQPKDLLGIDLLRYREYERRLNEAIKRVGIIADHKSEPRQEFKRIVQKELNAIQSQNFYKLNLPPEIRESFGNNLVNLGYSGNAVRPVVNNPSPRAHQLQQAYPPQPMQMQMRPALVNSEGVEPVQQAQDQVPEPVQIVPPRALSGLLGTVRLAAEQGKRDLNNPQLSLTQRASLNLFLEIAADAQKAGDQALALGKPLVSNDPHVQELLGYLRAMGERSYFQSRFPPSFQNAFQQGINAAANDIAVATGQFIAEKNQQARKMPDAELAEQVQEGQNNPLAQKVLANLIQFRKDAKAKAPEYRELAKTLSSEELVSVKDPHDPKYDAFQKELDQRQKQAEVSGQECGEAGGFISRFKNLFGSIKNALKKVSICGEGVSLDEKEKKIAKLSISSKAKKAPKDFPELNGPPFDENVNALRDYIGYFKKNSSSTPACTTDSGYEDGAAFFQAVQKQGYRDLFPADTDSLLSNVKLNKKKWLEEMKLKNAPLIVTLTPWASPPPPQAVINTDGRLILAYGKWKLGEGSFKTASSALTVDLNAIQTSRASGDIVLLNPKDAIKLRSQAEEFHYEVKKTQELGEKLRNREMEGGDVSGLMDATIVDLNANLPNAKKQKDLAFIQERMDGDLKAHMNRNPSASEHLYLLRNVAQGALNLHQMGYVHSDIKEENVFVKYTSGKSPQAKIGDFGGLYNARDEPAYIQTDIYSPPEAFTLKDLRKEYFEKIHKDSDFKAEHVKKHDVFSIGVMAFRTLRPKDEKGDTFHPFPKAFKLKSILVANGKYEERRIFDLEGMKEDYKKLKKSVLENCGKKTYTCLEWHALQAVNPDPEARSTMQELYDGLQQVTVKKNRWWFF